MRARDNPFRTERVLAVRFRPQGTTWDALLERLAALGWRAAIVGPDGSGKTTLLEDLAPRLAARGLAARMIGLDTTHRAFPLGFLGEFFTGLGEREVIFLDGADLMGRLAWARFQRRAGRAAGLVVTSHRPGLLPTLIECSTSPELLDEIVRELLPEEAAALRETTRGLFRKHGGDIRKAIRELYDLYAGR